MAGLSAAGAINTQLEQVQDSIPFLVEKENTLDKYIQDNGRATRVSLKQFRVIMETALPGSVSKVDLDSASVGFPAGGSSEWMQGTVSPMAFCVPIEWTKLAELAAAGDVAVVNTVAKQLGRATDRLKQARDQFLQTDGTGKLAVVTAIDAVNRLITLNNVPFGARLINKNQVVGVFNGNAKRGGCTVTAVNKQLGGTQSIKVDQWVAGTGVGDFIRVDGVEDGGPIFLNGIPVFHQTAKVGTTMNIDRSLDVNNFIIANGVDAGGGQVTQPLLKVPFNQIKQELGEEGMKQLLIHTHPAQVSAYEEMGWILQTYPLNNGKASDLDLFFTGKKTIEGRPIVENIHAAVDRWDYMNVAAWGKVKWGNPPFWFTQEGRRVFEIYAANGSPTAGARSFLIDCLQYYCDNLKSISSVTNAKVPVNY
jgi:hypothetical protein